MAQRDEKLNGMKSYLPLFNGTAGWKVDLYLRCSMAHWDEKLIFTYRLFNGTAGWQVEIYLPLFNGTAGYKVKLYLHLVNGTAG